MVRKITCLIAIMCVCLSVTSNAFAYTSYDQGNISTTYVQYFEDIVDGLPVNYNYVGFRSGQYQYILYASDVLKEDGGIFTGEQGVSYIFDVSSGYNSSNSYSVRNEERFSLDTNSQMVYSNIGDYPHLDERSDLYEFGTFLVVFIVGLCAIIRPIYKYVLRQH